ncbi:unnamed protein product [Mytilus coruscus]|uniref:Uncharacterized protein n=1 Tax=Mytilus coruscus TaxID=42192 RepID=A0A6J8DDA7_MYTCO|nr:unnamed protein product [Mytilus coruscus]
MKLGRIRLKSGRVRLKLGRIRLKSGRVKLKLGRIRLKSGRIMLKLGQIRLKSGRVRLKSGEIYSFGHATPPALSGAHFKCLEHYSDILDSVVSLWKARTASESMEEKIKSRIYGNGAVKDAQNPDIPPNELHAIPPVAPVDCKMANKLPAGTAPAYEAIIEAAHDPAAIPPDEPKHWQYS